MLSVQFEVHSSSLIPGQGDSRGSLNDKEAPRVLNGERGVGVHLRGFPADQGQLKVAGSS